MSTLVAKLQESCELIKQMEFDKMDWAKHVNDLEQLSKDIGVLNVRGETSGDWQKKFKKITKNLLQTSKTRHFLSTLRFSVQTFGYQTSY